MNKSFLKWAGGKSKLTGTILSLFPDGTRRYFEPFVGSGVVALNVPEGISVHISDVNEGLMDLWKGLRDAPNWVIEASKDFFKSNTEKDYYHLRERFNFGTMGWVEHGALFLYLNRHCFNGLCRFNAKGGFNVPYGKYAAPYFPEEELTVAARLAKDMCISTGGFEGLMKQAGEGDVVYSDPPYIPVSVTSNFTSYSKGGFGIDQQLELLNEVKVAQKRGATVIISNNDVPLARELYDDATEIHSISVTKSISCKGDGRKKQGEIIAVYRP